MFLDAAAISEIQVLIRSLEQLSLIGDIQHRVLELLVKSSFLTLIWELSFPQQTQF